MNEPPDKIVVPNKTDYTNQISSWSDIARFTNSRFLAVAATDSGFITLQSEQNESGEGFLLRILSKKIYVLEVYDLDINIDTQIAEEKAWNVGDRQQDPRERYVELYLVAMREIAPFLESHVEHHAGLMGKRVDWKSKQHIRSLAKSTKKQRHLAEKVFNNKDLSTEDIIEYEQNFHSSINDTLSHLSKYIAASMSKPGTKLH